MKENNSTWLITAKTNLHVGNENTSSYGLIDKSVQRDALTGLPCINSSSLKGALNEYFTVSQEKDINFLKEVFGADKKKRDTNTQKGKYTFFDAQILFLPVQGENELFYLVTTDSILKAFIDRMKLINISCEENTDALLNNLRKIIPHEIVKLGPEKENEFKEFCDDDNLPIIARNKLDNGESANLWYEQILPQETVFYTIMHGKSDIDFSENLNEKIVQIGANATIGYGYCKFQKL